MSFNVKHYVAMVLGMAVCAAFVLHQPSSDPATPESKIELSTLSPLAGLNSIPNASTVELKAPITPSLQASDIVIDDLMAEANLIVFDEISVPEFVEQATNHGPDPLNELDGLSEIDFDDLIDDSFAMDETNKMPNLVDDVVPTSAGSVALVESGPVLAPTHHFQRPNSRWKRNPFIEQASQLAESKAVEKSIENTPETKTPKTDVATRIESTRVSIIVEPIDHPNNNSISAVLKKQPVKKQPVEKSILAGGISFLPSASIVDDITPVMPSRLENLASEPSLAEVTPSSLAISDAVAQQAAHHIEYGKSLARRGAAFAAGQEFMSALKVIAQANDDSTGSNEFSTALAQAVMAMKEAKDFANPNVEAQMIVEVSGIVEPHRTNIIHPSQAKTTTPAEAMQKYFAFAKQKLDQSSGRNVVSAEALYCLGKLHTAVSVNKSVPNKIDVAKAITFHQAALLGNANDFRSANELGVLMAKTGQLAEATSLFKQSLIANPTPQTWKNLAKTHHRMGQQNLAQLAEAEFSVAVQTQIANSESGIQWMPTTRFNESAPMEFSDNTRVASRPGAPIQNTPSEAKKADSDNKSLGERLKDLF